MEKIRIKEIIDFKRKSSRAKTTFAEKIKTRKAKPKDSKGGGDWWVTSLSAISNVFKTGDHTLLTSKVEDLYNRIDLTDIGNSKIQFAQNIEVLKSVQEFDFNEVKPKNKFSLVKTSNRDKIIKVAGYPVQAWPQCVFSFEENNETHIGAVWFVTNKNPFKDSELGIYAEMLHRYLTKRFSSNFKVNPVYCIAVEPKRCAYVNYKMIKDGKVKPLLKKILIEIQNT